MGNRREQAEHCRKKADEALVRANSMKDPETKRFLIGVANDYLEIAEMLEQSQLADMFRAME